jgi:mannan endo-1,4-beta-mannosidase
MIVLALSVLSQPLSADATRSEQRPRANEFVRRVGPQLRLNGKPFRFAGSNNYYLMYKSQVMVDDVLESAAANDLTVMRIWGSLDIGNQDDSNSLRGKADGVYFQYWDGDSPAYNDGADGLERLDYVVYRAGQLGLKLVIPFVNNWNDFGGMDQYVRWRDSSSAEERQWYHDDFYTDPQIRQWYKDWIAHVLNRTNSYTGIAYKHDPTIMTWELGNEPRCLSAGAYPRSPNCTTQTLTDWADEMSTHIKSVDPLHLVSVGDEGFYCLPNPEDWIDNCGEGVDTVAFTSLPNIDVMSYHLYPDHWGKTAEWGTEWITRHIQDAQRLRKPAMLGEYGFRDKATRNVVFKEWTDTVFNTGGTGALYWILSGKQDDGSLYPDYDGFTVYDGDPVFITITNFGQMMRENHAIVFPPVADHDAATTEFETAVVLNPPANDVTYGGATLDVASIDLDPATAGQQTSKSVFGGTFTWQADGTIAFAPDSGFAGKAQASYTIRDSANRLSNVANLVVTVRPNPTGALPLFQFETGTEGWASASWQTDAGTTEQSTEYFSDGAHSLKIVTQGGGWFGTNFATPADLSGKTHLKYELKTTNMNAPRALALQVGESWTWCQTWAGDFAPNTTTTVEFDLNELGCDSPNLSQVRAIWVYFNASGTYYIDNIRAE